MNRPLKFLEVSALTPLPEKLPKSLPPLDKLYERFQHMVGLAVNLGGLPGYFIWVAEQWVLASANAHTKVSPSTLIFTPWNQAEYNKARSKMFLNAVQGESDMHSRMVERTKTFELLLNHGGADIHSIAHGVLESIVVQSHTAFEVLVSDTIRELKRTHPTLIPDKKFYFITRQKLRESYKTAFNCPKIDQLLKHDAINALCLLRNAIVHSGCSADDWFMSAEREGYPTCALLKKLFPKITINRPIQLTGDIVREVIEGALFQCYVLLSEVEIWIDQRK